ncbi:MAG: M20/M25/M40 family metallo-hydrolase [Acidobacteriota bacterium]|nr:M20/M25/M40 family metallo-hydrolase [Acidobacteriota bacterium]
MDLFELTRKLIDIPSVTGDENSVGMFLTSNLERLGYRVQKQEVENKRFNVIASTEASPRVVLSTHMDTVPPHIPSKEDADRIYGRGACDAKGIIAAQIMAAEELRRSGVNEIGLLFTVDEEMSSAGARVANQNKLAGQTEYLINGEPTDNKLATATKGSLRLTVTTSGKASHSAYPEYGESAIEKLLDVLESLRRCDWPSDKVLGATTCNIGVISGGTRPNVTPAEAAADLQLRIINRADSIKTMIEDTVAGRAEVQYLSENDPVHLVTIDGFEQCVVRFTTDIPYLSNWGAPLLLGPGSILNAHTDHEFVEKRELTEALELYASLARSLLAKARQTRFTKFAEGAPR